MRFDLPIAPPDRVTGLVAGRPSAGGGIELPVFYPATGARIATLVEDDAAAVDAAVTAARRAIREGVVMPLGAGLALERALTQPLTVSDTLRTRASAFVGLIGNPAQNT